MSMAQTIVVNNPIGGTGPAEYWDPWFDSWGFMPGFGFGYSPFGFGFYSPAYWDAYALRPWVLPRVPGLTAGFVGQGPDDARRLMRGARMMQGAVGGGFGHGGGGHR